MYACAVKLIKPSATRHPFEYARHEVTYSGGPTEMSSSDEITAVEQDGLSDGESDNPESHSEPTTTLEGFTPSTGDEWPAGTTLPLNSKRLNLHKWRYRRVIGIVNRCHTLRNPPNSRGQVDRIGA